ncbi:hypothetical protein WDU94_004980 [Cyamophila willieti]
MYLDHEPGAFLSSSERDAVLFTFSLVSVLSSVQLKIFFSTSWKYSTKSVHLIRAANLFMKATSLIINLNAVCGFPIPLEAVNGHNYWQGSIVQQLYQYLNVDKKTTLDLVKKVYSCLKDQRIAKESLDKFAHVLHDWVELGLIETQIYVEFEALMTSSGTPSKPFLDLTKLKDEINQIGS